MNTDDVHRVLLEAIAESAPNHTEGVLTTRGVLLRAADKLGCSRGAEEQHLVLNAWCDLFRMGVIAWGADAGHPGPEFAHLTDHGRNTLAQASRDPANRAGYLAVVNPHVPPGSVERSYVEEALATYAAGCNKASAVMIGAAAEAMIMDLRDDLVAKMESSSKPVPKNMRAWQVKTAFDAVEAELRLQAKSMDRKLLERLDSFGPLAGQLRMPRNEAGHPTSVDPVTRETVHASLLLFPELARLVVDLREWVRTTYA